MSDNTTSTWQELLNQRTPGTWYATDEGDAGSDLIIDESGRSLLTSGKLADGWAGFEHVPDAKLADRWLERLRSTGEDSAEL